MTTARLRDAGGGWRCSDDGKCCTSPDGSHHHAHRIVGELLVCSTGEHETVRMDGRPMTTPLTGAGVHRRSVGNGGGAPPVAHCAEADAEVSAILTKLRTTAASIAGRADLVRGKATSTTIRAPRRLHVVAGTAPAPSGRDHDAARAIAHRLTDIATGARMRDWARQLDDLAAEIGNHAAADDLAVLRRVAARFATVGARLGTTG